ncbi:MAG: HNH endonuclease [Nitrosomonadales bacterium]|nr:HNH endonuclease [Nitrosomonadales bacterium]
MEFKLDRPRANEYPTEAILDELRRVAAIFENRRFTRREFDTNSNYCKGSVVLSRFGTWQAALDATGLDLIAPVRKDRHFISNEELFSELGRIWHLIGHRPSKDEWESSQPIYSYTTYKTRFGGWVNACAAFIEYTSLPADVSTRSLAPSLPESLGKPTRPIDTSEKRSIPMKLRYQVLARDCFKCVVCGRSPATHAGVVLHIDHIKPFSKGGKTVLENLRSLCQECNWGKGDDIEISKSVS